MPNGFIWSTLYMLLALSKGDTTPLGIKKACADALGGMHALGGTHIVYSCYSSLGRYV